MRRAAFILVVLVMSVLLSVDRPTCCEYPYKSPQHDDYKSRAAD